MDYLVALTIAGLAGTWAAVVSGTWKLFENADKASSASAKSLASKWLGTPMRTESIRRWALVFADSFDAVFGTNTLSRKTFLRSCIASLSCVAVTFLAWITIHPQEAVILAKREDLWLVLLIIGGVASVFNILPDYLSLLKTRYFIGLAKRSSSSRTDLLILSVDAITSTLIGLAPVLLVSKLAFGWSWDWTVLQVKEVVTLYPRPGLPPDGLFFYASFLTSFWLWVYFLASFVARAALGVEWARKLLASVVDIEAKPLLALGVIATFLETIVFLGLFLLVLIRDA